MEISKPKIKTAKHAQQFKGKKTSLTRESVFAITINTNRVFKNGQETETLRQQRQALYDMFKDMFGNKNTIKQIVTQRDGGIGKVLSVDSAATIEVGSDDSTNKNQLHLHGAIKIKHTRTDGKNSRIMLDFRKMREMACRDLKYNGGKCPYITVKALPSSEDYDRYINKYL